LSKCEGDGPKVEICLTFNLNANEDLVEEVEVAEEGDVV
jgi:hypothetical protein